jgi:hypothetical protein
LFLLLLQALLALTVSSSMTTAISLVPLRTLVPLETTLSVALALRKQRVMLRGYELALSLSLVYMASDKAGSP